jgi:uncharacterized glyoxalase superfamily protein PhnB
MAGQTIFPGLRYNDAHAAIAWMERALGAERQAVYEAPDGGVAHAQIRIAGNLIMLGSSRDDGYDVRSPKDTGGLTASLYVVLPGDAELDALHARAVAAGAKVTSAPHETDYGSRDFSLLDTEGQHWTFGTYQPEGS